MHKLMGTQIDKKNIGLARLLAGLRDDLDIYCLISVNADNINQKGIGKLFLGHIQQRAIESISLCIYKIYEYQNKHELNSIAGILRNLNKVDSTGLNERELLDFIQKYGGPLELDDRISALEKTFKKVKKKYRDDLKRFETFRHKKIAHSEYSNAIESLPSYDVMQQLFNFGVEFYELVSSVFIWVVPADLRNRRVKISLKRLLQELGIKDIKDDMY